MVKFSRWFFRTWLGLSCWAWLAAAIWFWVAAFTGVLWFALPGVACVWLSAYTRGRWDQSRVPVRLEITMVKAPPGETARREQAPWN